MKSGVRTAVVGALILAALLSWFFSEMSLTEGKRSAEGFSQIRLTDSPISAEQVKNMREASRDNYEAGQGPSYAGWTQKGAVKVENPDLLRSRELTVIYYYCGSGNSMFAVASEGGCAISPRAAYDLFGTQQVPAGAELEIEGKRYRLEKVLPEGSPDVVAKLPDKSEILLDVLDVHSRGLSRLEFSTDTVIVSSGLTSRTVIEYDGLFSAAGTIRNLPVWIGLLIWIVSLVRNSVKAARAGLAPWKERGLLPALTAILASLGGWFLLGAPIGLPQRFVPTMWSDFSFWSAAFSDMAGQIRHLMTMELYLPDQHYRSLLVNSVALGWVAALLLAAAAILIKPLIRERRADSGISDS